MKKVVDPLRPIAGMMKWRRLGNRVLIIIIGRRAMLDLGGGGVAF